MLKHRTVIYATLFVLFLVAGHSSLQAQSATATLSGTAIDQSGAAVPGVEVTIINSGTGMLRKTVSSAEGAFIFPLLPPGQYKVTAQRDGFTPTEIKSVILNVGDQVSLSIQLKVGQVSTAINVTEEVPLINESSAVGTVVDRKFVNNIPLNGRTLQSLMVLTPGVVFTTGIQNIGQISVNGERTSNNYFTVDGISANVGVTVNDLRPSGQGGAPASYDQQVTGQQPAFNMTGGTQSMISVEALQEFRILTSNYAAEFGRQSGGQIQLTSRSGSNQYHGNVYEYFRNEKLDANDWVRNSQGAGRAPLRLNDFGGTFSGPIFKDKTFFFYSIEAQKVILPSAITQSTVFANSVRNDPKLSSAVRALVLAMPPPTGPDLPSGLATFTWSASSRANAYPQSVKIDHRIGSRWNLFGWYNHAPSNSLTPRMNSLDAYQLWTNFLNLGATTTLSNRAVNELRFSYSTNKSSRIMSLSDKYGAQPLTLEQMVGSSTDFGIVGPNILNYTLRVGHAQDNVQRQMQVVDNFSYLVGNHSLKLGGDWRFLLPTYAVQGLLTFSFNTIASLESGVIDSVSRNTRYPTDIGYQNLSLYAQDTWRASRRLTLDYGLRWEFNPAPYARNGTVLYTLTGVSDPSTFKLAPAGTPLYPTIYSGFAPRFGAAWQVRQANGWETVVRGGWGIFYSLGAGTSTSGTSSFPNWVSAASTNVPYPFASSAIRPVPRPSLDPPYTSQEFTAFDPDFTLPRTYQWNLAVAQNLGAANTLTVTYVGSASRHLLRRYTYGFPPAGSIAPLVNAAFPSANVNITRNNGAKGDTSDYNALQLQFNRRLSRGLQVLANYSWAHAIDTGSSDSNVVSDLTDGTPRNNRGNADTDIRHIFNSAITYDLPKPKWSGSPLASTAAAMARNWSLSLWGKAQSAPPLTVTVLRRRYGISSGSDYYTLRTDFNPNVPLWISDPTVPGEQRLNIAAFPLAAGNLAAPAQIAHGNEARNAIRGFGAWQIDFGVQRSFPLTERFKLEWVAQFYNVLNHPSFTQPYTSVATLLPNGTQTPGYLFGISPSQLNRSASTGTLNPLFQFGGPRSIQFALKLQF